MSASPETVAELVQILSGGDTFESITRRVAKIESDHQRIGAVIRLSFDLPVLKWGAEISVYAGGRPFQVDFHSGLTASALVSRIEEAFDAKFWLTLARGVETRCPKCGNTGVECYDDPADKDVHLRPCDCPIGRAKSAEHVASVAATPLRHDMGESPAMERRVLHFLATSPRVWLTHDTIWRGVGSPQDPDNREFDVALIELRKRGSVEVDTGGSTLRYRRLQS